MQVTLKNDTLDLEARVRLLVENGLCALSSRQIRRIRHRLGAAGSCGGGPLGEHGPQRTQLGDSGVPGPWFDVRVRELKQPNTAGGLINLVFTPATT